MKIIRFALSFNFIFFIILLSFNEIKSMAQEEYSHSTYVTVVTHQSKHSSDQDAEYIAKAISYILGSNSPHISRTLPDMVRERMRESETLQQDIRSDTFNMDVSDLQSNDDQVRRYSDIKRLIGQCVEQAIKTRDDDLVDCQLQIALRDKDISLARKKIYLAAATSGLSFLGIVVTFLTTYFAK